VNKLIFDAGPLITSCKFSVAGQLVIDHLLLHCEITIAASVRDEVVVAGNRYADAKAARQRINKGQIAVLSPSPTSALEMLITPYNLGDGERESIFLATAMSEATLVIDDHLAYLVSDRLGQRKRFLLDILADLVVAKNLDKQLAIDMVQAIRSRYPTAFVEHTLLLLRR
jgi:predicted nucleic acid-binding protein